MPPSRGSGPPRRRALRHAEVPLLKLLEALELGPHRVGAGVHEVEDVAPCVSVIRGGGHGGGFVAGGSASRLGASSCSCPGRPPECGPGSPAPRLSGPAAAGCRAGADHRDNAFLHDRSSTRDRWTRPLASPPTSRSTSSTVTRLKSAGIVCFSALAATANRSAASPSRPVTSP